MAPFNPALQPTNDPNYGSTSRPIDIPETIRPRGAEENRILPKGQELGDRSAEFEGKAIAAGLESEASSSKGFGDLFAGIVGIGDFVAKAGVQLVKKDIEDQVFQVADAERQRYTRELENIKAGGGTKNLLDANASMEDQPDEISELPDTLATLSSARNAGKISNTDYVGRLTAAAKDLRARYPGFRAEIDQEFAKVTGMNPANAYINKLVTDINRQQLGQNKEKNQLLGYIRSRAGYDDAKEAYEKVESGQWGGKDVIQWAAPQESKRLRWSDRKAQFDDETRTREDRIRLGTELYQDVAAGIVESKVNSFSKRMGITSEETAREIDARTKNGGIPSQRWSEIGQLWADEQLQMRSSLVTDARESGLFRVLGPKKVNELIDETMKQMSVTGDRIFNKDSGGIFKSAQWNKALGDEDQRRLLTDSIVGTEFRAIETIKRIGGEQFLQSENLRKLTNGLPGRFANYQERWVKALQTQEDSTSSGVPITLNRAFDEFKKKMKDATPEEKRKMNASMIDEISRIGEKGVPDAVKINYAQSAFHPSNQGFISRLEGESQNTMFRRMTTPEITAEMKRIGQEKPEVLKNYIDWTTKTLANELLSKEFAKMGQIRNPAIKVGWNSDSTAFVTEYNRGLERRDTTMQPLIPDAEYPQVVRAVAQINDNLKNYKNVAAISGVPVDAFILGSIVQAVGPQALQQVDNIPGDIMRQIGLTQLKPKKK